MFFQLTAKVTADAYIDKPYEFTQGLYTIKVNCDENKKVNQISIKRKADDYKDYIPKVINEPDNCPTVIIGPNGNPYADDLISVFQYLESVGSFWLKIKKIHWEYWSGTVEEWIPENEAEQKDIDFNNFSLNIEPVRQLVEFKEDVVAKLLIDRQANDYLAIPLSFYREGINALDEFRFIQAFYNFYFYLEGLYGNGKWRNIEAGNEFKSSTHIKSAITKAIKDFHKPDFDRDLKLLNKFIKNFEAKSQQNPSRKNVSFPFTINGMIDLIIQVRGTVHHCSQADHQSSGHPFRQYEFEGLARFLLAICLNTFVSLDQELFIKKPKFLSVIDNHPSKGVVRTVFPHDPQNIVVFLHRVETNESGKSKCKEIPYKTTIFSLSPAMLLQINNALVASPKNVSIKYPDPIVCDQCNQPCNLYISSSSQPDRNKEPLFAMRIEGYLDCKNCDNNKNHKTRILVFIINEAGETVECEYKKNNCLKWSSCFVNGSIFACAQCFAEVYNEPKLLTIK